MGHRQGGVSALLAGGRQATAPGVIALIAAAASIVTQGVMFWYAFAASKRLGSAALRADSFHHASDALSSVATLAGIGLARLGVWFADAAASIFICLFIVYAAWMIARDCVNQLIDAAPPRAETDNIREVALSIEGVVGVDVLRCRMHGNRVYVDIEIAVDKNASFSEAHRVSENVHEALEAAFPKILHCTVHANPCENS